jgi:hypothetical protein
MTAEPGSAARKVVSRLQLSIKNAARKRNAAQLAELERAMTFVARGHTAGEATLIERLAQATDSELHRLLLTVPGHSRGWDLEVRLTGLVLFQPAQPGPVRVASPECQSYKQHFLTSMEP